MNPISAAKEKQAQSIIAALAKRGMTGYYFPTAAECTAAIAAMITGGRVSWGGSETLSQCGIPEAMAAKEGVTVLDRSKCKNDAELSAFYKDAFDCDYYFMSSNAITLDGQLINIDGNGNRVASLIFGPKKVFIVAGMNKVTPTVDDGIRRVRNFASPPNAVRLSKNTPCAMTGKCGDCLCDDCICSQIVITRRSRDKERIHVFLVGEELGF